VLFDKKRKKKKKEKKKACFNEKGGQPVPLPISSPPSQSFQNILQKHIYHSFRAENKRPAENAFKHKMTNNSLN
jgi:hypothetical protein